jgi:hypothetical protein
MWNQRPDLPDECLGDPTDRSGYDRDRAIQLMQEPHRKVLYQAHDASRSLPSFVGVRKVSEVSFVRLAFPLGGCFWVS